MSCICRLHVLPFLRLWSVYLPVLCPAEHFRKIYSSFLVVGYKTTESDNTCKSLKPVNTVWSNKKIKNTAQQMGLTSYLGCPYVRDRVSSAIYTNSIGIVLSFLHRIFWINDPDQQVFILYSRRFSTTSPDLAPCHEKNCRIGSSRFRLDAFH